MRKTTTTGRIGLVVAIMALGLGLGGSPCLANDENADGASVIVQGSDLASAAEAVRSVGGEISHELGIIDAVRAELSAEQLSRLSKAAGVKRIYGDRTVHAAGVVTAATRDDFVAASYGGNDGTANWTGDWVDSDPDYPGTLGGTIKVNDQPECPSAGTTFCVFFQANKGYSLTREVDLSAAASATLTYGYAHEKLGGLVTVLLEVSSDGGQSWAVLKSYSADIEADGSETFDLSPYLAANTQIRFRDAQDRGKKLYLDDIQVQFTYTPDTDYPTLIGADLLHAQGIDGSGVTVAVVDTGYWSSPGLDLNSNGQARLLAQYDAIADQMDPVGTDTDTFGHGTHLTSVALSSAQTSGGKYNGIAPGADLVSVKAFSNGTGTYADAIRGIGWVVANQSAYGIGVMNLSFAAAPSSHYWDDPLNQAVMAAWEAGIVVVASAGNTGPGPMTVGVPGNTPYVITVGAMSDAATPGDGSDDYLASFSSTGPTVEGFVKPEVVAPGGHMLGLMATDSTIAVLRPEYQLGGNYFTMSGTSQSAALVSGIVALILDDDPTLTPDGVKCRLLASARAALDANDDLAYSIFQQGAGLVHAYDAVYSTASGCANLSLDIATDLAGTAHYGGPARRDTVTGIYYHADQVGYEWDGSFFAGGFPFIEGGGFPFIEGGGFPFIEGGGFPFIEGGGFPFIEGSVVVSGLDWLGDFTWTTTPYVWSSGLMETMSVNQWVPQE